MAADVEQLPETSIPGTPSTTWKAVCAYEVFARESVLQPWQPLGSVVAPNDRLAQAYARAAYDEARWAELMIAPAESQLSATRQDAA